MVVPGFYNEFRTFVDGQWAWSRSKDSAHVFAMAALPAVSARDDYERSAQFHIVALKAAGEPGFIVAFVFEDQARRHRDMRRMARESLLDAVVREETAEIEERKEKAIATIPERIAMARRRKKTARARKMHVSSRECFERLEREGLA